MRRNHLLRLPPACVTMYSLTLVFSRDVAPLPRHVMPHTDGAVIVKSICSGRDDGTLYLLFLPQQKYCRHGPSAKNHPEIFLLLKVYTLSTTPSMLSMSTMLTMSINANRVLTLCNVGALCNNSLLHVPAQGKLRKNCESCPHKLPGKSSLNNGSVRPVCPLGSL